jgi:uncharacterized protein
VNVSRPFQVNVAELVRRPGSRRALHLEAPAPPDMVVGDAQVPAGTTIAADLELESLSDGVTVSGRLVARWTGTCRRCLGTADGDLEVSVLELYQAAATTEEAYRYVGDLVDLGPMVRESLMLDLPLAPLCRDDCPGLCPVCGADLRAGDCGCDRVPLDPRWGALADLRDRLDPPTP